jgi:predicted alpha/beta-hydrolase family hydrolase
MRGDADRTCRMSGRTRYDQPAAAPETRADNSIGCQPRGLQEIAMTHESSSATPRGSARSTTLTMYETGEPRAAMILAHGAGAGSKSAFIVQAASGLAARRVGTATFDFPYMAAGRKVPDAPAVLEASWREAIARAREAFGPLPLFIGGKSMGGRIASQVAAASGEVPVAGLVFLGYPLHPPGKPHQRRDAHLPSVSAPMLFVQGSRDGFGTADEIRDLLPRLQRATLHVVEGGDHSFKVAGRGAPKPAEVLDRILDVVADWIGGAS